MICTPCVAVGMTIPPAVEIIWGPWDVLMNIGWGLVAILVFGSCTGVDVTLCEPREAVVGNRMA